MENDFLASVILFAGDFAPKNWMFCDGTLLPIMQNTALFSLLGTQYGGNGQTTFALPRLNNVTSEQNAELRYIICVNGLFPSRN